MQILGTASQTHGMNHKVADLEGVCLDSAVAKALGWVYGPPESVIVTDLVSGVKRTDTFITVHDGSVFREFAPHERWSDTGPIIERERIAVLRMHRIDDQGERHRTFCAWVLAGGADDDGCGPYFDVTPYQAGGEGQTYLTAAMRAYVASKLRKYVLCKPNAIGSRRRDRLVLARRSALQRPSSRASARFSPFFG